MKKQLSKVPKLKEQNGTLSGGFASLNEEQMYKIKGGKKNPLDTNTSSCNDSNREMCNSQCANTVEC